MQPPQAITKGGKNTKFEHNVFESATNTLHHTRIGNIYEVYAGNTEIQRV